MTHTAHSHSHDAEPMTDFSRASWEAKYREREALWSGQPNAPLVDEVENLAPASALEVGCGEGADAVWLATQGWQVTGVDLSATALARAQVHAEASGVSSHVTFTDRELSAVIADHGPWELVTSMYTHPGEGGRWLVETLAAAVAPGGRLLVVGHHPTDPHAAEHPDLARSAFAAEDVADVLDRSEWEVSASIRERVTMVEAGHERLWRDAVLVARRH
ncbi:bifunctional 2-polyprenyl-6-hydroxyphenol methylase/3-demethylubiquinol 3-O-methyltransferase UbiG [Demequina sp. NBRC 110055]|uniref:class I SAM-dependent methyltransferase n=1 Tax=Demequina sp. NBRC 110055 TaxID=1570344 RepID=UPI00135661D3|nr:methyltransferase domain-containing protein [Demequina sp. NBRC 110055]